MHASPTPIPTPLPAPPHQNTLFDGSPSVNSVLRDSSDGAFSLDLAATQIVPVQINVLANTLGCTTDAWASAALEALQSALGVDPLDYVFR